MAIGKSTALYGTPGKPHSKLPKGWARVKINDCVNILDKRRVPINSSERKKRHGSVPYYGATGQVGWIDDFLFNEELVLLGEDGAPFLDRYKNKAYVISGKSWVNNHAHVLQAVDAVLLNKFLCHFLNQVEYGEFVTGTTRLKLNQSKMKSISILLPPLAEQRRIVARVESIFARIDAARGRLERLAARGPDAPGSLAALRASVLRTAFEGRLVPQDPRDGPVKTHLKKIEIKQGDLPKGWVVHPIGDLIKIKKDKSIPSKSKNQRWIGLEHIEKNSGKLIGFGDSKDQKTTKAVFKSGDVLYGRLRPYLNKVHVPSFNGVCSTDILVFSTMPVLINRYFAMFLLSNNFVAYATANMAGVNHPRVSIKTISKFLLPLPPLAEQRRIVARLESILGGIDVLQSGKNSEVSEGVSMMSFCCTVSIVALRTVRIWLTQHAFPLVFGLICLQTAGTSLICPPCGGTARRRDRPC